MPTILEFLDEKCDLLPRAEVHKGNLFREYFDWATSRDVQPLPRRLFDKILSIEQPMITAGIGRKSGIFCGVRIRKPIEFIADRTSPWDHL